MTPGRSPIPRFQRKGPRLPRRKTGKQTKGNLLWIVIGSGFLSALLIFMGIQLQQPHFEIRLPGQERPVLSFGSPGERVLLVMGVDAPNHRDKSNSDPFEGTRTDTMMLVRVDGHKKNLAIVSIPRDSKVYLPGNRGVDKINAAHAQGGAEMAVATVQNALGIPVDNFIVINFAGVRELVDAIGGVDLYVEKPMHYTDHTAKLRINFEQGMHEMDGKQAEAFLRFRHDELGDIGRVRRQQQFIKAVTKKLKSPWIVTRLPQLVKLSQKYVTTDLSMDEMLSIAFFGKEVDMTRMRTATLPGHPGGNRVSYWNIDPAAAQMVLDRLILNNPEPVDPTAYTSEDPDIRKIGIFYDPDLAGQVAALETSLQDNGFRVLCKNRQRRTSTQIIEHTSRVSDEWTGKLRKIEPRLSDARLIFAPVGTTFENNACSVAADYTIVLGGDSK